MKFTTFFTQIMLLNTMGALGIRHVINIMGYVRDIPDKCLLYKLAIIHCDIHPTVLWSSYFTDQEDV